MNKKSNFYGTRCKIMQYIPLSMYESYLTWRVSYTEKRSETYSCVCHALVCKQAQKSNLWKWKLCYPTLQSNWKMLFQSYSKLQLIQNLLNQKAKITIICFALILLVKQEWKNIEKSCLPCLGGKEGEIQLGGKKNPLTPPSIVRPLKERGKGKTWS